MGGGRGSSSGRVGEWIFPESRMPSLVHVQSDMVCKLEGLINTLLVLPLWWGVWYPPASKLLLGFRLPKRRKGAFFLFTGCCPAAGMKSLRMVAGGGIKPCG